MPSSDPSDPALLAEWHKSRSETAFRALVGRYAGLVHAAARRTCGDDAMAAEAAQLTFITLAQKARSLASCPSLGGWLHRAAVLHARNLRRKSAREYRKLQALQSAMENPDDARDAAWRDMQPVLDDALSALSDKDREALLLRFYRALSVKEVAATLGIAADAAQKRIDRATARLRDKLVRRGCRVGGSLSGVMVAGFAADAKAAAPAVSMLASKAIAASAAGAASSATATVFLTAAAMKTTTAVVPTLVVLAAGVWLFGQFRSIADLEERNARLQKTLAVTERSATGASRPVSSRTPLDKKPVDWAEVARQLEQGENELSDEPSGLLKTSARLEAQFRAMSRDELLAALDEIATANLPGEARELLEKHICDELIGPKGGPKLVLDRFAGNYGKGGWAETLATYFTGWAEKEPDQAVIWFQQNVGKTGRPDALVVKVVSSFLQSSPDTATRILTTLPESQRLEAINSLEIYDLSDSGQVVWAEIVRAHLPEKDRLDVIIWPLIYRSGPDDRRKSMAWVGDYLNRIQATPDERKACILSTARGLHKLEEFDGNDSLSAADKIGALRQWVSAQAPDLVEEVTGVGLYWLAITSRSYADTADLALRLYDANPSDELLIPLLDEGDLSDEDQAAARAMAGRLSDEALRRKYLEKHQ